MNKQCIESQIIVLSLACHKQAKENCITLSVLLLEGKCRFETRQVSCVLSYWINHCSEEIVKYLYLISPHLPLAEVVKR